MTKRIRLNRWGLDENPTGLHVAWTNGRRHVATVTGFYHREQPFPVWMLTTSYFNGEPGPDVCAGNVEVLERCDCPSLPEPPAENCPLHGLTRTQPDWAPDWDWSDPDPEYD